MPRIRLAKGGTQCCPGLSILSGIYSPANSLQRYADFTAETTSNYGTALIYYARAHNPKKVKEVLDLLISFCLVQSIAYPSPPNLDPHLKTLLLSPRASLKALASEDEEAARILSMQMSGYAVVRKFYDIRDEDLNSNSAPSTQRLLARKRRAATALMTVIASAADNIQGGLYDQENPAVVPVDGLLVLLGEASTFVDRMFSLYPSSPYLHSSFLSIDDCLPATSFPLLRCPKLSFSKLT